MDINEIYDGFRELEQVEALALGGSRASGNDDQKSDYDLYVYVTGEVEEKVRQAILFGHCTQMEIGNHYFEYEDNVILDNGVGMDIIYRYVDEFARYLDAVLINGRISNGYTTCFWHNLRTCEVIFDKTGRLSQLKEKCDVPYPENLKEHIIERNMNLLSGALPSYDKQIKKAFDRHDYVSVNHRVTAFLESYFDVIFAVNEMTHPGEKKLVSICKEKCKILPEKFEENILRLFDYMFKYDPSDILEDMVKEIKKIV